MPEAHPDTPWWSNLVAVLVTAVVAVVGTVYAMRGGVSAPGLPAAGGLGSLVKDTLVYMPHALLLYGVLADMLTYEGVYSIGSLVGLLSVVVHVLFKFVWKGTFEVISTVVDTLTKSRETRIEQAGRPMEKVIQGTKAPKFGGAEAGSFFDSYTGCDLQGFAWAHSPYAPQTLVIIASVFSYYGFDLVINRGAGKAGATIGLGLLIFLAQLFLAGNCSLDGEPQVSKLYQAILAGAEGLFVGGVSYSVVQAYYPNRLPSSTISPFPRLTPADLKDGKFDKDGNPWICVGGICYPDMSTQAARTAFAGMVAESTGNGRAATGEDCAAH